MRLDVYVHLDDEVPHSLLHQILAGVLKLQLGQERIMATQAETEAKLTTIADQLDKAKGEIVAAIQALKDALSAAGNSTPGIDAAVARLEGGAQALDDLNPDAPAAP